MMKKMIVWTALLVAAMQLGVLLRADELNSRIEVAVIPPYNFSERRDLDHWRYMINTILVHQLVAIGSIRILPESSVDFALNQLKLSSTNSLTDKEVLKVCELIGAKLVCFGCYNLDNGKWVLNFRIVNSTNSIDSGEIRVSSESLMTALARLRSAILTKMNIVPEENQLERLNWPLTHNEKALELFSEVNAGQSEGKVSLTQADTILQQVLSIDPEFSIARQHLAYNLACENRLEDAEMEAKIAIKDQALCDSAHFTLGSIYYAKGLNHLAEEELERTVELNPDWAGARVRLADIFTAQGNTGNAIGALREAERLAPFDREIHAKLGLGYAKAGMGDEAVKELVLSDRIPDNTHAADVLLGDAYELLDDVPKALEHFEAYLQAPALDGTAVAQVQRKIELLKSRMTPKLFDIPEPKKLNAFALENMVKEHLTSNDWISVVNPLKFNEEMASKAKEITFGSRDDVEKGRKLFKALMTSTIRGNKFKARAAEEVFSDWSASKNGMLCQDYAFLYIALARAVGLNAYFVLVDRDYRGKPVVHACAAIFSHGKAILIDPTYRWFGIDHKEFELEDDLRVTAFYLAESEDKKRENLALELEPDWDRIHYLVAIARIRRGEVASARDVLQKGLGLNARSPLALYTEGVFAMAENDWNVAVERLKAFCRENPDYEGARYDLGRALFFKGDLGEAREQFSIYLNGETEPDFADEARGDILYIDQKLGIDQRGRK